MTHFFNPKRNDIDDSVKEIQLNDLRMNGRHEGTK